MAGRRGIEQCKLKSQYSHRQKNMYSIPSVQALSPRPHPKFNREVRRSPTWHSSESESALERFEPVAAAMLWSDGSLAMFAPEGDDCLQRAKREDAGRFSKEGKSLDDFWYTLSRRRRPRLLRKSVNSRNFQRACRQCVHESARFFRVICSHAWYG